VGGHPPKVGGSHRDKTQKAHFRRPFASISGAGEEIRTLDVHLGKTIRTVSSRSGPLRNAGKRRKYELRRCPGVPTVTPKWGAKWGASTRKWGASLRLARAGCVVPCSARGWGPSYWPRSRWSSIVATARRQSRPRSSPWVPGAASPGLRCTLRRSGCSTGVGIRRGEFGRARRSAGRVTRLAGPQSRVIRAAQR
jgi:hypothetical protein